MSARILYGLIGSLPPHGDMYAIPGLEGHRKGIKRLFNAMLFATKRMNRFPKNTHSLFPAWMSVGEAMSAIRQHHQPLQPHFFTGIGHQVQFIESEIMIDVLLSLRDHKVTALPIHDAVLVPGTAEAIAKEVMLSAFYQKVRVGGSVSMER